MKIIEQHKVIQELKDYVPKMSRDDRYHFEMFQKRDKDDEELDSLASAKLEEMQKRYIVRKSKQDIEALFKKMTASNDDKKE